MPKKNVLFEVFYGLCRVCKQTKCNSMCEVRMRPLSLWLSTRGRANETIKDSNLRISSLFSSGTHVAKPLEVRGSVGARWPRLKKSKFGTDWSLLRSLEQSQIWSIGNSGLMTSVLKRMQSSGQVESSLGKSIGAK